MAEAPRDGNHITTALANDAGTVRSWKINEATHRALISIPDITPPAPTPFSANAQRDGNHVTSLMGLVDGTATLVPLMCDSNGYLILDLVVE